MPVFRHRPQKLMMKILYLIVFLVLSAGPVLQAGEKSASEALSPVYERMMENKMEALRREYGTTISFVFMDASTTKEQKLRSTARTFHRTKDGFLIVTHVSPETAESRRAALMGDGLKIIEDIRESELEFLKDASGRQVVDLSDPKVIGQVYERLVYEGIHPVQAWPLAEEAVRRFRTSNDRILIAGRPENS